MAFDFKNLLSTFKVSVAKTPDRVVGIDFGSSSVKVVELEQRQTALTLVSYGELQLAPYAQMDLGKPVQLEQPKRIEALVDVLRESKVKATTGVFALPLTSSFVTIMSLTAKDDEDLAPRVRVEARKYIPVPITDVVLDWTEIAVRGDAKTKVREILVAAIQNDTISQTRQVMEAVQMANQPNEIELFSTIRAVTQPTDTAVGIIDIGAQTSKLYIAEAGALRRIHRVYFGGVQVTEKLAAELNLPFVEAENAKRNYTAEGTFAPKIKQAFVSGFERPLQEFKRVLEQYEVRSGTRLSRIVVTGGSAAFTDLPHYASYIFDRDVERANIFSKVAYPAFLEDTLADVAPVFTVALGAALRPYEHA